MGFRQSQDPLIRTLNKVAKFIGIGETVHAQAECWASGCMACYTSLVLTYCSGGFEGEFCAGAYLGHFDTGPAQQGFQQLDALSCGPVPPCACQMEECSNPSCPSH